MLNVRFPSLAVLAGVLLLVAGCAGGDGEEEAPAPAGEQVPAVADSIIESQVQASLDADPRLDREDIQLEAHSRNQEVTLVGTVPSRFEMSIARGNAQSVLGVRRVLLDSLVIESETRGEASARQSAGEGEGTPAETEP
ncbi:MAG: BON domain-containing protein [Gemmatimonadota bacterium]